jgi:hypothetical protein
VQVPQVPLAEQLVQGPTRRSSTLEVISGDHGRHDESLFLLWIVMSMCCDPSFHSAATNGTFLAHSAHNFCCHAVCAAAAAAAAG